MRIEPGARVAAGRVQLLGVGLALPGAPVSTTALCARIEERFGVPAERTGRRLGAQLQVETRHLCRDFTEAVEAPRPGHRNPELAATALAAALADARVRAGDLDYLLTHTATPARALPGGSAEVAARVGARCAHAEFRQACTGFANALQFAFALLREPGARPVAIVGSETGSVFFDPRRLAGDAGQWVNFLQMGDGAAAVVLGRDEGSDNDGDGSEHREGRGGPYLSSAYFGQSPDAPAAGLQLAGGGSDSPAPGAGVLRFAHDFAAVARHGPALLEAGVDTLRAHGHPFETAARFVPHQASGAVAAWFAQRFGVQPSRVCDHARRVGNLGSASLWAALCDVLPTLAQGEKAFFLGAEATQYSFGGFVLTR
jgi:3-oxoacyl-[acyl-carrier-protein] synthase III